MKTRTKVALAVLCALLLVTVSILGTLAYLTSQTETVSNTFTVGNVEITLDEAKVDEYGVADAGAARVEANTYKLIPGHTYTKDPTIKVAEGSENCWLFVKVENGINAIEATGETDIEAQLAANGWTLVDGQTNVYARATVNEAGDLVPVFANFKVDGEKSVAGYETAKVDVTGYAIQADGFDTAADAWDAAPTDWTNA